MGRTRSDPDLFWLAPRRRGILPLDAFHVPRSLRKLVRRDAFTVAADDDFPGVVAACAAPAPGREDTWITPQIETLYAELFRIGAAHSISCRRAGRFAGGLYGVAIGGAFFGESMVSLETGASKVALVHLVARLRAGGYRLLDVQFVTPHLARFGAAEIPRNDYLDRLDAATTAAADFHPAPDAIARELFHLLGGE